MHRPLVRRVTVAMMGALAFVMQFFDFPLPAFPSFLKVDFSEVPALAVALMYGPWSGIGVEGLKNVLHYLFKGSETGIPVGQAANFLAGSVLVVITSTVYRRRRTGKALFGGLFLGTLAMAAFMSLANYWVIFPVYITLLGFPMDRADVLPFVLTFVAPFNVIKGGLVTAVFMVVYVRLRHVIERTSESHGAAAS
ncbi:MAG: ECF transporter S component [Hydrogenibacillus sp.]|nr:ECF transporter S component [Hydrogenibacillus sp.]